VITSAVAACAALVMVLLSGCTSQAGSPSSPEASSRFPSSGHLVRTSHDWAWTPLQQATTPVLAVRDCAEPCERVGHAGVGQMDVVTFGSGSCPSVPDSITVLDPGRLVLHFPLLPNGACTADLSPTISTFTTPNLDQTGVVAVQLVYAAGNTLSGIVAPT
jgi:hypothetical protein